MIDDGERRQNINPYRALFESSLIALWEEDFSSVKQALNDLKAGGVTDLEVYLHTNPEEVKRLAGLIKVIEVNQATLDMIEAETAQDAQRWFEICFLESIEDNFIQELIAFEQGSTAYSFDYPYITLRGKKGRAITHVNIVPGFEQTWGHIFVSVLDITERSRTEQELFEREQAFRTLVDNLPGVVYRCELHSPWKMEYISEEIEALCGYPVEDFLNGSVLYANLIHPDDWLQVNQNVEQAITNFVPFEVEYRIGHADGGLRWVHDKGRAFYDAAGNPLWLDGVFLDITQRKKMEADLIDRETRYRSIFENSPIALSEENFGEVKKYLDECLASTGEDIQQFLDHHPEVVRRCASLVHFTIMNEPAMSQIGITHLDEIKVGLSEVLTEEGLMIFKTQLIRFWRGEHNLRQINMYKTPQGEIGQSWIHLTIPPGYQDTWEKVIVSVLDITERHKMEQALRQNEMRLEALLELNRMKDASDKEIASFALQKGVEITSSRDGFLMFLDETETEGNMYSFPLTKYPDVNGSHALQLYKRFNANIWEKTIQQRKPWVENEFGDSGTGDEKLPKGHTPINRFLLIPVVERDHVVLVGGVANKETIYSDLDVRELSLLYEGMWQIIKRRKAEEALLASQKLAELGTLAAGIAHEINSPLQVITGQSESLIRRVKEETVDLEKLMKNLETINANAWRVAHIVRSLLTYARSNYEKKDFNDLNDIVQDALLMLEHQYRSWSSIEIISDLSPQIPLFYCDRNGMTQVLINLLSNARDAMPHGGKIYVHTAYDVIRDRITLEVTDNGVGISDEVRDRIFDPFFTTKPLGQGTGLGLSIVLGIVHSHGGEIEVESTPNRGSTFLVSIPRKMEANTSLLEDQADQ